MAYNTRYLFKFDSAVNGIAYEIHIMEDGYAGGITQRALGASPTLRRDNSGHIAGTSLEFLAECVVDGEFSILYTPDPFRFKVVLYQNDVAIWSGFVSPELYAEPDIAPPYDVNITAVDGLGELKRSTYQSQGEQTIGRIITYLLSHTGLSLSVSQINSIVGGSTPIMDVVVDLDNIVGESCYDVLQSLLETMNAIITQRGNTWLIARENDMSAVDGGVTFGSMDDCAWWPVGQMRSEIIPAKRKVVVTAENSYKEILKNSDMSYDGEWEKGYTTIFDTQENAYLVGLYSISQTVNFAEPLAASLVLRVKARAKDADNQNGSLRFRIGMEGYVQGKAKGNYRLLPSQANPDVLTWRSGTSTASFDKPLSPSQYTNSEKDATEIEIVLPFFRAVDRDFKTTCDSLTIDIYGADAEDFYIYEASLQVEYQTKGNQDVLRINNGAREDAKEVGIAFNAGNIPNGLYGTPTGASGTIISQWSSNDFANLDYLAFIARDYAKGVALPRMNKSGKLNVGTSVGMPLLFMDSEGVAYFPKTLSWDLYNDEMDVNLVSLPNAIIEVESENVGEITGGTSPGSSTGSVGGGGVSGATTLDGLRDVTITEPREGDTLMRIGKEWVNTPAIWSLDENGNIVTDRQVIIRNNLIVHGDSSSGGEGSITPGGGGIVGIKVNGTTFYDTNADGIIDLGTISGGGGLTSVSWADIADRPTALSEFENDLSSSDISEILGYTPVRPATLNNFLPKTGGQLTGALQIFDHLIYDDDGAFSIDSMDSISLYAPNDIVIWSEEGQLYFNDKPVLTEHQSLANYVTNSALSSALSNYQLANTAINTSNIAAQSVAYAANAGAVGGVGLYNGTEGIATITSAGVMEVGQYIDFHKVGSTRDYSVRLNCSNDNGVSIHLPSAQGTLALSSQIPTQLSQLTDNVGYALASSLANYLPLTGGTLSGALTVASTIQANSVICGTARLRVNASTSAGIFAFMDARPHSSGSNRATAHIGSAYGNLWDITNIGGTVAISIYKGSVGVGREFTDAELKAASDGSVGLTVAGNQTINGNLVVTGDISA